MTFDEFHNALRIMASLDEHELVAASVIESDDKGAWGDFTADPYRWFIRAADQDAVKLWALIQSRQTKPRSEGVTPEFKEASAKAAIRALRGLEQTAIMLDTYAPEIFPEVNDQGQIHFGRAIMESAATSIRDAWKQAISEVEGAS